MSRNSPFVHLEISDPQVISQLRVLSRSVVTGLRFDRELWSSSLSPILHLWKKINQVRHFLTFSALTFALFFSFSSKH